jgi:hypothetical protein
MNDLHLIVCRLADLGERARVLAGLAHEARHRLDLPPERARQVLAGLAHLAGELDAIGSVLGGACDPQRTASGERRTVTARRTAAASGRRGGGTSERWPG